MCLQTLNFRFRDDLLFWRKEQNWFLFYHSKFQNFHIGTMLISMLVINSPVLKSISLFRVSDMKDSFPSSRIHNNIKSFHFIKHLRCIKLNCKGKRKRPTLFNVISFFLRSIDRASAYDTSLIEIVSCWLLSCCFLPSNIKYDPSFDWLVYISVL